MTADTNLSWIKRHGSINTIKYPRRAHRITSILYHIDKQIVTYTIQTRNHK